MAGADITSGLPRVEELFEARSPRGAAVLSEISGKAEIIETPEGEPAARRRDRGKKESQRPE